jgi:hypothetical protein
MPRQGVPKPFEVCSHGQQWTADPNGENSMKAISLPCGKFDLKGFATAIVDGSQCITQADDVDAGPLVEDETEEAVRLIESGHPVFFGFHHSYIGEDVLCADGGTLLVPDENDKSVSPVILELLRRTKLVEDGNYGFLISKQGSEFSIQPAFEIDSVLRFEPQSDCGLFNDRMERFCRRFIRG